LDSANVVAGSRHGLGRGELITGHLSRRMLEHYSHIRLNAKKAHSIA
jgi:hypothetical protein